MKFKYLTTAFFSFMMTTPHTSGQVLPDLKTRQQMQKEENAFLKSMKPGLQHEQMLAVRAAMKGDETALQKIRQSRNVPPVLPNGVKTGFPTPDICLFSPAKASKGKRPLLLYLHGGGWCFGSINSCARFCAAVALEGDCLVAALNYRLSPAYGFPVPLNDCQRAFSFILQHAETWGGDPLKVFVGGDSAGGNLALATALSTKGVAGVVSIYPVTKLFTKPTDSWIEYAKGYGDDAELLEAFNEAYAGSHANHPLASVALADDEALQTLPPVLLISAGHDILFDQTAELAQRLQRLNHLLCYHVYPTATHLFITVPGQPTAFNEAVKMVAGFLSSGCQ